MSTRFAVAASLLLSIATVRAQSATPAPTATEAEVAALAAQDPVPEESDSGWPAAIGVTILVFAALFVALALWARRSRRGATTPEAHAVIPPSASPAPPVGRARPPEPAPVEASKAAPDPAEAEAPPKPARPRKLFYSYAHKDEAFCEALQTHLAMLKRQGAIESWTDRCLVPGQEWAGQIDQHLRDADVILLLVSADFIASDYCYQIEMKQALDRHERGEARVIPIIVRPVDWTEAPFCRLQALPKNAQPVSKWSDLDDAWLDVAHGIRRALAELGTGSG